MVKPFNFDREENSKTRRKRSDKQEKRLASKTNGKAQSGSGAVWNAKGDVKTGSHFISEELSFLYECKQTTHKGFRVTTDLWKEIKDKAYLTEGKLPALQLELDINGVDEKLVCVSEDDWLMVLDLIKKD